MHQISLCTFRDSQYFAAGYVDETQVVKFDRGADGKHIFSRLTKIECPFDIFNCPCQGITVFIRIGKSEFPSTVIITIRIERVPAY